MSVPYGFVVGNKWYANCPVCRQVIRMDKPILGAWHLCLTDEEARAAYGKSREEVAASGRCKALPGKGEK